MNTTSPDDTARRVALVANTSFYIGPSLARELAPEVRVNAVAPGPILWPDDASFDELSRQRIISHTPLKREGEPDDIAKAVHFLLADAGYVTGETINVDGGRHVAMISRRPPVHPPSPFVSTTRRARSTRTSTAAVRPRRGRAD